MKKLKELLAVLFVFLKMLYSFFTACPVRIHSHMEWYFVKGKRRSKYWIMNHEKE